MGLICSKKTIVPEKHSITENKTCEFNTIFSENAKDIADKIKLQNLSNKNNAKILILNKLNKIKFLDYFWDKNKIIFSYDINSFATFFKKTSALHKIQPYEQFEKDYFFAYLIPSIMNELIMMIFPQKKQKFDNYTNNKIVTRIIDIIKELDLMQNMLIRKFKYNEIYFEIRTKFSSDPERKILNKYISYIYLNNFPKNWKNEIKEFEEKTSYKWHLKKYKHYLIRCQLNGKNIIDVIKSYENILTNNPSINNNELKIEILHHLATRLNLM